MLHLLNRGDPDRVDTGVVSSNFFDCWACAELGRAFADKDDDLGAAAVLMLWNGYWGRGLAATRSHRPVLRDERPSAHGRRRAAAIPQYPADNDVYMPTSACPFRAAAERRIAEQRRAFAALQVFGRLKPGVPIEEAAAAVATVAAGSGRIIPTFTASRGFRPRRWSCWAS